jgi:O-antigen ligase
LVDPSYGPANAQESAESRQVFFKQAVELWQRSPLLGFGPDSFRIASGTGMQTHSLYGQLFAEVGLAGMITFGAVLMCFVLNARDIARCYAGIPWAERGFPFWLSTSILVAVVLLLVQGLGGHNLFRYNWLWFGAFQAIALKCAQEESLDGELEAYDDGMDAWSGALA